MDSAPLVVTSDYGFSNSTDTPELATAVTTVSNSEVLEDPAPMKTLVIAPEPDDMSSYGSYEAESDGVTDPSNWFINIATYADIVWAERWKASLSEEGYPAVIIPFEKDGVTLHRIRVVGYADEGEAQSDAILIENSLETGPLWVGCMSEA